MERIVNSMNDVLTADQSRIMERVLAQEEVKREHVVVYLSGAHAYGFPSPDSDLDLKAIHVAKTSELVGLEVPLPTSDRAEIIDGVEIDYTSNELAHALAGILNGNGNFLERVLGRLVPHRSPLLAELSDVARRALSRRVHRHYRGFAHNQLRFLEKDPTAKKLLYVLRTTLTGIHLLREKELEPDLTQLMDRYGLADAATLIERKRAGERVALDESQVGAWMPRISGLFEQLDAACDASALPESPDNEMEARAWLISVRRAKWA